ncbi:MAG TPA: c-type cytochrome [Hyphomicrobiaceae bacterium]|jgi:cytochrome c|nr:c-type cytochrome [Hyphomicrobiaceae bacterium]
MLERRLALFCLLLAVTETPAEAQLRGHGGPVRALALSRDGTELVSGSFDSTAIRWSLGTGTAETVLRFHEGALNAVAFLGDGRIATSGEDGRIAIWQKGQVTPVDVLIGHGAPVVQLAVSPDGGTLASASWDGTARLWSLAGGAPRVLEGHRQNVNGVAFTRDGRALVSVGYDGTLRIWPLATAGSPRILTLPSPLNAVAVAQNGEIFAAGASGKVFFLSAAGDATGEVEAAAAPLIALAISGNDERIAASSIKGAVAIIARDSRTIVRTLVGPGLPAWAVLFLPDSRGLLTGGGDRVIRRWNSETGEQVGAVAIGGAVDPLAGFEGEPGAQVFRACVACHTLKSQDGPRAGPTLAGVFGRKIASLPGYDFSPALKNLDIVWTPQTLSKLFELGPAAYTPGSKMPEQKVGAEDRSELIRFLEKATKH